MQFVLEQNTQSVPDKSHVAPGIMVTPPLGEDYWVFRVKLSDKQAIIGFPKFMTIGIGFAKEEADWNTNLPCQCETEKIFQHIKVNKGNNAISDDDCRTAITMVKEAGIKYLQQQKDAKHRN